MEFRTPVETAPFRTPLDHSQRGLSLGSCFAEHIAGKMRRAKFRICSNPFGVLFNPLSVAGALRMLAEERTFGRGDLVRCGDLWCSFAFHGSFSAPDPDTALEAMNRSAAEGARALEEADYAILTFGTAWIYELAAGDNAGRIVANCHKFPADTFLRRRLQVAEIVSTYETLLAGPLEKKRLILTVSPVRHLKDGAAENARSKATLLLAAGELAERHPEQVAYFPAYEIMQDELRDYRFYAPDMVHPSEVAVDYLWERFRTSALTPQSLEATREAERLAADTEHRPLHPGTESHRKFRAAAAARARALQQKYPEIDFSNEITFFEP